jgi:hypothetical protein
VRTTRTTIAAAYGDADMHRPRGPRRRRSGAAFWRGVRWRWATALWWRPELRRKRQFDRVVVTVGDGDRAVDDGGGDWVGANRVAAVFNACRCVRVVVEHGRFRPECCVPRSPQPGASDSEDGRIVGVDGETMHGGAGFVSVQSALANERRRRAPTVNTGATSRRPDPARTGADLLRPATVVPHRVEP